MTESKLPHQNVIAAKTIEKCLVSQYCILHQETEIHDVLLLINSAHIIPIPIHIAPSFNEGIGLSVVFPHHNVYKCVARTHCKILLVSIHIQQIKHFN